MKDWFIKYLIHRINKFDEEVMLYDYDDTFDLIILDGLIEIDKTHYLDLDNNLMFEYFGSTDSDNAFYCIYEYDMPTAILYNDTQIKNKEFELNILLNKKVELEGLLNEKK